ncbi:MAG TPA: hypothetical protein VF595_00490 [Tepidisphaeraceae bacterium]|jgi:hypothetical protein
MIIDHRGERLRGGLEPAGFSLAADLVAPIDWANAKTPTAATRRYYLQRQAKSIVNRVRMKHLPDTEAAEPRYHELRGAGWSPAVEVIRVWFFALSADNRRELVVMARRQGLPYARAAWDGRRVASLSTVDSEGPRGLRFSPGRSPVLTPQRTAPTLNCLSFAP